MLTQARVSRRMVLLEPREADSVERFAEEMGLNKIRDVSAHPRQGIVREITWEVDKDLRFHYGEDYRSACCFVVVDGRPKESYEEFVGIVEEVLDPWGLDELLNEVDTAIDATEMAQAIIRVGLGAPDQFDEGFYSHIAEAIRHESAWVRKAGIWATAYSHWPEFEPLLREVAENDSDMELRDEARMMVSFYSSGQGES